MKVRDLLRRLSEVNPEAEVWVWLDGIRFKIETQIPVDVWDEDHVDINVDTGD